MATMIATLAAVPGGAPRPAARLNAASEAAAQFRARQKTQANQPMMALLIRFPRVSNIARMIASLGVPEPGPLTASRPTEAQNRLPTTITASVCHRLSPIRISTPPTTRLR